MNNKVIVTRLKAIADPTRLKVIEFLQPRTREVSEIRRFLKIEASLLSHHLAVLKKAGLISSTRKGKAVYYSIKTITKNTTKTYPISIIKNSLGIQITFI